MSPRRSVRLQNQETQGSVDFQQAAPACDEAVKHNEKPKAPPPRVEESARIAMNLSNSAFGKGKEPLSQAQVRSNNDALSFLPSELLCMVLDSVSRWTYDLGPYPYNADVEIARSKTH